MAEVEEAIMGLDRPDLYTCGRQRLVQLDMRGSLVDWQAAALFTGHV
jgi:hypothetical protein